MMMAHDVDTMNEAERLNADGEVKYLFRLLGGHLYEAGNAFRNLDKDCGADLDALLGQRIRYLGTIDHDYALSLQVL